MKKISLIKEKWIPVRFRDGQIKKISPMDLTDNNAISIEAVRPDFQSALMQFLISIIQTAYAPEDDFEWKEIWRNGIPDDELTEVLNELENKFEFGHKGPSFMQDLDNNLADANVVPISALLLEFPGTQTIKDNKDFFVKSQENFKICPHCAATALFSLQLNAPSGGQGYRTGIRGGGPLTTLIELNGNEPIPLWKKIWANVLPLDYFGIEKPEEFTEQIFPWFAKTRISKADTSSITPEQVHPFHMFWAMPWRVRIETEEIEEEKVKEEKIKKEECCLCGMESDELLSRAKFKNFGNNYLGFVHPFTPYGEKLKEKSSKTPLVVKGELVWKDWLYLNQPIVTNQFKREPAGVVSHFQNYLGISEGGIKPGLWAFGFEMDKRKVVSWRESHIPTLISNSIAPTIEKAVNRSLSAFSSLRKSLKDLPVLEREKKDVETVFWNQTYGLFLSFINDLLAEKDPEEYLDKFGREIAKYTLDYFDKLALKAPENQKFNAVVTARNQLVKSFYKFELIKSLEKREEKTNEFFKGKTTKRSFREVVRISR